LHVIPNGVDLSLFTPTDSPPAPEPALLFVGNYEYGPNVEAALWLAREIFPRVRAEVGGARLWLVGNGPPAEVQALAGSAIAVTGRVPDVRPYYAQAAVFIAPLRTGAGIKNKVLEAAAMAKPLIVTPVAADGIGLVAGQQALYGQTAAELAAAAIRLLNNPDEGRALGAAARRLVESRFTWEGVADQYAALYAALTRPNS
jgi:glycosyltransferase involved in cell wall biosynthesis